MTDRERAADVERIAMMLVESDGGGWELEDEQGRDEYRRNARALLDAGLVFAERQVDPQESTVERTCYDLHGDDRTRVPHTHIDAAARVDPSDRIAEALDATHVRDRVRDARKAESTIERLTAIANGEIAERERLAGEVERLTEALRQARAWIDSEVDNATEAAVNADRAAAVIDAALAVNPSFPEGEQ